MLELRTAVCKVSGFQTVKEWYLKVFKEKPYFDQYYPVGFTKKDQS
jgi:hypothetical protein